MLQEKLFKVGAASRQHHLVCADASTLCRQSDIGKTLIGKESTEDFEQVARVVVPFEAKLMMRHFHRVGESGRARARAKNKQKMVVVVIRWTSACFFLPQQKYTTTHTQPLETVESPGNELQSVSSVDSRLQNLLPPL